MIKKVNTEIFIQELETRGSNPSKFECSDNNIYVVKHSRQGTNFKHLINEIIAVQLAQIIKVSIPDFALVEIKDNIIPNDYVFASGKPSGLGFGSQFLSGNIKTIPDIETIINITKFRNSDIIEDFIKICAFDVWLRNTDRSVNNPNLLVQESGNRVKLYAIDHSSIFSELNYLDLDREIDEPPSFGENLIDGELFTYLYYKYGLFFDKVKHDICHEISNVSENEIRTVIENVPPVWNLNNSSIKGIFNFINKRKNTVEKQFDNLLNAIGL